MGMMDDLQKRLEKFGKDVERSVTGKKKPKGGHTLGGAADSALAQQSLPFTLSQFQQAEQPEQSEPPLASIPMTGCDGHDGDVDVTPAPEANRPTSPVPVRL